MPRSAVSPLQADVGAALDWWREAGVDTDYSDAPQAWLSDPSSSTPATVNAQKTPASAELSPEPKIGGARTAWPQDLASFHDWWLGEPSLDEGGLAPRIAPVGDAGAELMVVVAMPEESDASTLLAGSQGKLLDGFLAAAGLPSAAIYRAAVLPRYTPFPDWAELERQGMGTVLAHHVALVRPKRLMVLGRVILPLCGHDPAQGAQKLRSFNHEGGRVPTLYEVGLERLLVNWQSRARLWQRWLEWTDNDAWREGSS